VSTPLWQRLGFGAYAADAPWPDLGPHHALERELGVRLQTMSWFLSMDVGWPAEQAAAAAASGHDLLICLEPRRAGGAAVPFDSILAGAWDDQLDDLVAGAGAHPGQVVIRFAHEPNLDRLPWSLDHPAPCVHDLEQWIETWRYVAKRRPATASPTDGSPGTGNIAWMWCVDREDAGAVPAEAYWPGADVVDVLGVDAYNAARPWTSPVGVIRPMYDRVAALHATADVWLSEIGCRPVDPGEPYDKAGWFEELLGSADFPRLTQLCFFHADKEQDWRITAPGVAETVAEFIRRSGTA
jgi:mannan endo-1,4-beta-mannosidase